MTILEKVRAGEVPPEVRQVAADEHVDLTELCRDVAAGRTVVPANRKRRAARVCGIGRGLRTKVNANIGTSRDYPDLDKELKKLDAALDAGTDTVMDLSTGGDLQAIRRAVLERSPVPVGSVSIYDAAVHAVEKGRNILAMTPQSMLAAFRTHAEDGVDFITVHAGVTRDVVADLKRRPRVCGIVSRGGTFLAEWM